ncbi:hypothetical protein J3E69DRAFT_179075 [Trichoderma sp. SZMC 28015]
MFDWLHVRLTRSKQQLTCFKYAYISSNVYSWMHDRTSRRPLMELLSAPQYVWRWICANGGIHGQLYEVICHLKQLGFQTHTSTPSISPIPSKKEKNKKKLRGVCLIRSGCSKAGIPFTRHLCHFNHSQPLTVRQRKQKFKTKQVGKLCPVEQIIATPGHVVEEKSWNSPRCVTPHTEQEREKKEIKTEKSWLKLHHAPTMEKKKGCVLGEGSPTNQDDEAYRF